MKIVRNLSAIFVVAIISLACYFSVGVKGAWHYDLNPTSNINLDMNIGLFAWEGSEELPNLGDEGESHLALIERLTKSEYGLINPNSFLNEQPTYLISPILIPPFSTSYIL